LRIIGGRYRKKSIHPPRDLQARPTTDFAKEGLFNIIINQYDIEDLQVLDLFSGTGSIAYEFASRECKWIDCVDNHPVHYHFIRNTARELDFEQLAVYKADVFQFLRTCSRQYDVVFADPPYNLDNIELLPQLVFEKNVLHEAGMFILEHGANTNFQEVEQYHRTKKYGSVHFSFFKP